MAKQLYNLTSVSEIFQAGGMQYANYLLSQGQRESDVFRQLQTRFPDASFDVLDSLMGYTLQARQAGDEVNGLEPGIRKTPTDFPQPPGAESFGYTLQVSIGTDEEGNDVPIQRTIKADDFLTYEEILAYASDQVREIVKKYPDQFGNRGITLGQLTNWNVELAWAKQQFPAIQEFLEGNPLEE